MSGKFRPVEDVALRHVRQDQLAQTNWPAWQAWRNLIKRHINEEIKLAEQKVNWYNHVFGTTQK